MQIWYRVQDLCSFLLFLSNIFLSLLKSSHYNYFLDFCYNFTFFIVVYFIFILFLIQFLFYIHTEHIYINSNYNQPRLDA